MDQEKLKSIIESLLFTSGEPVKVSRLVKITESSKPEVENAILALSNDYASRKSGLVVVRKEKEVQLATNPDNAKYAEQLIKGVLQESLSAAAIEVLSIIAYRGPITRMNIESIRGVSCSYTLRNLLLRGLVTREENPKDARGYIYSISFEFLKNMGLTNLKELPDYENLSNDERIQSVISNQEA